MEKRRGRAYRDCRTAGRKHVNSSCQPCLPQSYRDMGGFSPTELLHSSYVFLGSFFFLDSFPGDPHLFYMLPRGQMGLCSPGGDQGLVGGKDSRGKRWKTERVHNWMP